MGNNAVIVGSGRCLLGRGLGKKIDSMESIVRFNPADEFLNTKYEKDVGKRMTTFVFNFNVKILSEIDAKLKGKFFERHKGVKEIVGSSASGYYMTKKRASEWRKINSTLKSRSSPSRLNPRSSIGRNCSNAKQDFSYTIYSHDEAKHLLSAVPFDSETQKRIRKSTCTKAGWHFTSGLLMICYFLEKVQAGSCDKVYICGFDGLIDMDLFLRTDKDTHKEKTFALGHYFDDDRHLVTGLHFMEVEVKIINTLISLGKIDLLK